jgi:putative ABC transport system permease protein
VPQATWLGLRGIFRKRGRTVLTLLALTLLALTLSATAFLAIQITTYSANQFIGQIFSQYGFDAFVGTNPQPYAKLRAELLAIPNVARVERFEQDEVSTKWGTVVLQATESDTQMYRYDVLKGRWFNGDEPNVALISDVVAENTGLTVGDTLTVNDATTSASWTIIGVVHDLNGGLGTIGSAFTTISTLHAFAGIPQDIAGNFVIQAVDRSPAAVNQMANTLDDTLARAGLNPFVSTAQQQIQRNQNQFQILYILLYAVAAIVALVGVLGLFNTLTTSVLERRREIGILRSMGASSWRVASIFWTEGLALAGIAWVVAVALGIPAAYGFVTLISKALIDIPFAFDPVSLLVMLAFVFVIATLASVIPVSGAARLRVAQIIRYE